jgi:uncharacterized membrane protein
MNWYFILKTIHILSAAILFGTGLGIAFFKWITDRSQNVAAIRAVSDKVVAADWLFTLPAIVVQLVTGLALAKGLGYPLSHGWLAWSLGLFCLAGLCWMPVVWLQIRMRDLARASEQAGIALNKGYWDYARLWFWLGVPAFAAVIVVFFLMVAKPSGQ